MQDGSESWFGDAQMVTVSRMNPSEEQLRVTEAERPWTCAEGGGDTGAAGGGEEEDLRGGPW